MKNAVLTSHDFQRANQDYSEKKERHAQTLRHCQNTLRLAMGALPSGPYLQPELLRPIRPHRGRSGRLGLPRTTLEGCSLSVGVQDTIEESDQVATEQTSLRAGFKMKKTQLMCSVLLRGHLSLLLLQTFFSPEEMANRGRSMNKARSVCCPATEEDAPLPVAPNVKTFAGLLLHRHRPCKKTDGDFSIGDMTATSGCANTPWTAIYAYMGRLWGSMDRHIPAPSNRSPMSAC